MTKYTILKQIMGCGKKSSPHFLGEFEYTGMYDLAETMVTNGYWGDDTSVPKLERPAFSCATFQTYIKQEYALPTTLMGLDFDEGDSYEDVLEFFKDYSYFAYTSMSHTKEHNKFRVIIELDIDVRNNDESHMIFEIIRDRLAERGFTLDKACKDISRRFVTPTKSKTGEYPDMNTNEGLKYPVGEDFVKKIEQEIIRINDQKQQQEILKALNKLNHKSKKINVEQKIQKAQLKFLEDTNHESLRNLISSLMFWEMQKHEIINWVASNYRPTSGNARDEAKNWYNWLAKKNNETYTQKYGIEK